MLTLGNWIFLIIMFIVAGLFVWLCIYNMSYDNTTTKIVIGELITLILFIFIGLGISWYNGNTASGIRAYKDYQSNMSNGIEREITITAEDGREIFHYEGKVDVESNHTDNYIKFESEEGKRYIIYYGIQDTIQIIEK